MKFNFLKDNKINFQYTVMFTALAESLSNIILVWLIYNYTHDPLFISLITFTNYFPMILSVITFIFIVDLINPLYQYYINNLLFLLVSLGLFLSFYFKINILLCTIIVCFLQMIYSVVRITNKTNSNKIIKLLFDQETGNKIVQASFSIIQICQTLGNLIANFFIVNNIGLYGYLLIISLYLICYFLSYILYLNNNKYFIKEKSQNNNINFLWFKEIFKNKDLIKILFFSIPSSGIYQYINTILPFLSKLTYLKSSFCYSILTFSCTFLTTIMGFLIYKNILTKEFIERYTFLICFIILTLLGKTRNFFLINFLIAICSSFLTAHVLCMQLSINMLSDYSNLGRLTILRNAVASLSKILFSFLSVYILNHFKIYNIYFYISYIALFFQLSHYLYY